MKEKHIKTLILIAVMTILGIMLLIIFIFRDKTVKPPTEELPTIEVAPVTFNYLDDYPLYFTINDILENFYINVNNKLKDPVYALLSPSYIKNNDITLDSIFSVVKSSNPNFSFTLDEVFASSDEKIFFTKSKIYKVNFEYGTLFSDFDYVFNVVSVSYREFAYSIEPISEQDYLRFISSTLIEEEVSSFIEDIESNEYNEFTLKNPGIRDVALLYYNHFFNLWQSNKTRAKELIEDHAPENFNMSMDLSVETYTYSHDQGMAILTDQKYGYVFNINKVLDYTVQIMTREEFDNYNENMQDN